MDRLVLERKLESLRRCLVRVRSKCPARLARAGCPGCAHKACDASARTGPNSSAPMQRARESQAASRS